VSQILNNDLETHLARFNKPAKAAPPVQDPAQASSSTPDWLNKCHYKCRMCPYDTYLYNSFLSHLSKQHNMSGKAYAKQVSLL
jgi:hypothetical protein